MKTVILTSRLGYGHTRAGEAIATALRSRQDGVVVEMLDFWSLMAPKVSDALKEAYLLLVSQHSAAYEELYQLTETDWKECFRSGRLPAPLDLLAEDVLARRFPEATKLPLGRGGSLDETMFVALLGRFLVERQKTPGRVLGWGLALGMRAILTRRLQNRLQALEPDVVVATQMLPATLLSFVRGHGGLHDLPAIGVLTDYGVHDFWIRSGMDHLCVAHEDLGADLEGRGAGGARALVTGMPLMPEFQEPPSQAAARQALGLSPVRPAILVTGGAYGIGVAETLAQLLAAEPDWQIVATTGGGETADSDLARLVEQGGGRLLLFDWCRDMAQVLSAADVVVGKPGGLTISEAMACGRPFLAVRSLAGQESYNVRFLERHGAGRLVPPEDLVDCLRGIFAQAGALDRMQEAARGAARRDGAQRIALLIQELTAGGEQDSRWAMP